MRRSIHLVLCAAATAGMVALAACGGSPGANPASSGSAPSITSHPGDATVTAGQTASFSVVAAGSPSPSYQWKRNGVDIPGATGETYVTPALALADGGATYSVAVRNSVGSIDSNGAALAVRPGSTTDKLALLQLLTLAWDFYDAASAPLSLVEDSGTGTLTFGDPSGLCGGGTVDASFNGQQVPTGTSVPTSGTLSGSFNACMAAADTELTGSTAVEASLISSARIAGNLTVTPNNLRQRTFDVNGGVESDVTVNGSAAAAIDLNFIAADDFQGTVTVTVAQSSTLNDALTGLTALFDSGGAAVGFDFNPDGSGSLSLGYDVLAIQVSGLPYSADGTLTFAFAADNRVTTSGQIVFRDQSGQQVGRLYAGSGYGQILLEVDGVTYGGRADRVHALKLRLPAGTQPR